MKFENLNRWLQVSANIGIVLGPAAMKTRLI